MNRVYCSIITNVTREQAKRLNLNASYLNNLISTLKSIHNNANLDVTDDLIKEYLENNKDKLLDIQLAIPLYKIKEDSNLKRGGYSNNIIEIYKFNDKYTPQDWLNESAKLYEVTPFMLQNLDLFDSTKAIYTYQLYLWKLLAERGLRLYTMKPEEKAKYINSALRQLKQAKERYKDAFNVKTNKAIYNFDNKKCRYIL